MSAKTMEKGTLSLVLGWDEEAAGKTFLASVPLEKLKLDGRDDACFLSIEAVKLCSPRRGVKVALIETEAPEADAPKPEACSPVLLRFSVKVPADAGAGQNRVIAVVGRVAVPDASEIPPTREETPPPVGAVNCLRLTNARGESVSCEWREAPESFAPAKQARPSKKAKDKGP